MVTIIFPEQEVTLGIGNSSPALDDGKNNGEDCSQTGATELEDRSSNGDIQPLQDLTTNGGCQSYTVLILHLHSWNPPSAPTQSTYFLTPQFHTLPFLHHN